MLPDWHHDTPSLHLRYILCKWDCAVRFGWSVFYSVILPLPSQSQSKICSTLHLSSIPILTREGAYLHATRPAVHSFMRLHVAPELLIIHDSVHIFIKQLSHGSLWVGELWITLVPAVHFYSFIKIVIWCYWAKWSLNNDEVVISFHRIYTQGDVQL